MTDGIAFSAKKMEDFVGVYCCRLDGFCNDEREEALAHLRLQHGIGSHGFHRSERNLIAEATDAKVNKKLRCLEEGFLLDQ